MPLNTLLSLPKSLTTVTFWAGEFFVMGAILWIGMFSNIPSLYPLDASTEPLPTTVTTKDVPRQCRMSPGGGTLSPVENNPSAIFNKDSSLMQYTRQTHNIWNADKSLLDALSYHNFNFSENNVIIWKEINQVWYVQIVQKSQEVLVLIKSSNKAI